VPLRVGPGDDYPLHTSARPVRDPGTERNLYDRFFLNGYQRDGNLFFALALGQYPGRNVMDAAFSVIVDGVQHNLRASRLLGDDRLDTTVGPIRVRVDKPLRSVHVLIDDTGPDSAKSGIAAHLAFTARGPVFEEAPFRSRSGYRLLFDYTRMTQNGAWSGQLSAGGHSITIDPASTWGTKDRSWGVRPVGEREHPGAPEPFTFFWLWAPMNFEDACGHFDVNEHPDGTRWHETAMWSGAIDQGDRGEGGGSDDNDRLDNDVLELELHKGRAAYRLYFPGGDRHARGASVFFDLRDRTHQVELESIDTFFMNGIGYSHPTWGHGMYVGDDVRSYDSVVTADVNRTDPQNLHIQALCRLRRDDGVEGMGILEQLFVGPHTPSGLSGIIDAHRGGQTGWHPPLPLT
jgi:hypothetical protein